VLFLGGSERSGEKLRAEVNDSGDAGFEFETVPEDDIGFIDSQVLVEFEIVQILMADKPSQRSNKEEREERKKRGKGI